MEDNNIQDSCCNSKYASIRQMDKLDEMLGRRFPFYPRTVIQAVHDGRTGASLEAILAQYNNIYVQYQGTAGRTRNIVPKEMRRKGIIISYVDMQGNAITEKCVNDAQRDNFHWGLDVNWVRVDELTLSGDISVSVKGTWVINGEDTGIAALGPKGDNGLTPWLKTIDNKLHFSYDNETWEVCSDYIAAYFRFQDNKFQISRDNKTWSDLSGEVTNSLSIKAYVTDKSQYPNPKQGDMIMVGPTYADDDTEHTKPIYHLNIYNAGGWVDHGPFQSINAGVVQELGDSETEVMSQKAVSKKFSEFEEIIQTQNLYPKLRLNRGCYINVNNEKISDREASTNYAFKVVSGEVIIYRGNYGGSCPAINFYNNGKIISSITKTDLEVDTTIEIVVPEGADSAIANSFNTDVNVIFKDGVVQRLQQNVDGLSESNKLLERKDNALTLIVGKEANIKVGWINVNGQILTNKGLYTEIAVEEGDTFSYYGSYGGACAGYIIYDNNNFILVKKEKADLGNISEDIEIPENGVLLKACSFTDTFNITYKGSIKEKIDKLINLSSNLSLYPLNSTNLVKGKYVSTSGTLTANEKASYLEFLIKEGDVISYEGNYGANCAGIAYYDVNNTLISVEQKENLGSIKTEFTAPTNSYKAIASTFNNDLIVYYKDGLRGVLNEKLETDDFAKYYHYQSLYEKFDFSKLTLNSRDIAVNQAILFSAWMPKNGHENDEIYLISLSAYYDESLDTQEPTRYDIWVYNQTVRVDVLQYINKTPSTQDRYHIVYKDTEYGTL